MNRRELLRGLSALAVMAAVPAQAVARTAQEWLDSGLVENQTFYLDEPLVLENVNDYVIRNCKFIANTGFRGKHILRLANCHGWLIHGAVFDASRCGGLDAAIYIDRPCLMNANVHFTNTRNYQEQPK